MLSCVMRLACALLFLSAGSWSAHGVQALDMETTSPTAAKADASGIVTEWDIDFLEPGRAEKLDLYLPADRPKDVRSPAVVIIHGGGWVGGDKRGVRERVTGTALAEAGYVCASVEYMKEAGKRWPTNLYDCKNAVRWLRKNADRLQVDSDRIGVIGGSAGGHLALTVAYTPGVERLEPPAPYPGISSEVHACVNMYGITNLVTRKARQKDGGFGEAVTSGTALFPFAREENPELWKLASPVNHISPKSPPTLIIHGTADSTVNHDQATELAAKLAEHGVLHELLSLPGAPHAFALNDKRLPTDLRPDVVAFFDKHLKR